MRTVTQLISGVCLIVMVSAISASGFVSMGISGIARTKVDQIKSAIDNGASPGEIQQIAQANGFTLSVK